MLFNPNLNKFDLEPFRRREAPDPFWARTPSKPDKPISSLWTAGGVAAGAVGLGFAPFGNSRGVDYYHQAATWLEQRSLSGMAKTFGVSDFLFPLTKGQFNQQAMNVPLHGKLTTSLEVLYGNQMSNYTFIPKWLPWEQYVGSTTQLVWESKKQLSTNKQSMRSVGAILGGEKFSKYYIDEAVKHSSLAWYEKKRLLEELPDLVGAKLTSEQKNLLHMVVSDIKKSDLEATKTIKQYPFPERLAGMNERVKLSRKEFAFSRKGILGVQVSPRTQQLIALSRAYASSQIQRFNTLLQEMSELSYLHDIPGFKRTQKFIGKQFGRIGLNLPKHVLSVPHGPALKMLGGLAGRAALVGLGIHGLSYLDYLRRTEDNRVKTTVGGAGAGALGFGALFRNRKAIIAGAAAGALVGGLPQFDEGIYAGFAGLYTKGQLLYTKFSDITGLTAAAQKQEELAPGITELKTPLGFAGAGALTGYLGTYAGRLAGLKGFKETGKTLLKGGLFGVGAYAALAGIAAIATGTYLPGILGSDVSHDELQDIYSGKQDVAVRKGRWWEFGRTPWEGTKVDYYRQHWYPKLLSGARDVSLYGSEQEKWAYDPVLHPFKALFDDEFKYHRELKNQYTRPYPVTGTYFEDIPFIGPILAGTIGKLIKPTRYMHTDKWLRGGDLGEEGVEAYNVPHAGSHESVKELGGLSPDVPLKRYDIGDILGKSIYRLNELRGLTGFAHGAIKEHLTGSQDYFDEARRLESSTRAYGAERWYWDQDLGGLLGMTEAFRRYVPHRRRQIEQYNPISNLMPSWVPGSNYYIDFHTGDPYTKVKEGDIRLPGRGYETLHPELKGLHSEEYPAFHKFKILADVAMWSEEFKQARKEMRKAQKRGQLSTLEMQQFQTIIQQVAKKKEKREFKEYEFAVTDAIKSTVTVREVLPGGRFTTEEFSNVVMSLAGVNLSSAATDRLASEAEGGNLKSRRESIATRQQEALSVVLQAGQKTDILMPRDPLDRYKMGTQVTMPVVVGGLNRQLIQQGLAEQEKGLLSKYAEYSPSQRGFATAWEIITHKGETPLEILTPFAPMTKFVHARSAVEEYERTQVFGTQSAFWQHPIEHFFKPFMRTVRGLIDEDYIPEEIQHRRQLQDYFDKLKYVKYARLEHLAEQNDEHELSEELRAIKRKTLFGVDPYGSFSNILTALPGPERDFFMAFSNAKTPEERERILQLIPPNQRAIYLARWQGRLAKQLMAERTAGISEDISLAAQLSRLKKSEGRPHTIELIAEYQESDTDESYADWHREKELKEYFENAPLPGPNWIGWHPKVDLDDIKLKIVETLGEDMHDYGLWQSRARTLRRKPYIDDAATEELLTGDNISRESIARRLREILSPHIDNLQISTHYLHKINQQNEIDIELSDDRMLELQAYFENPDRE